MHDDQDSDRINPSAQIAVCALTDIVRVIVATLSLSAIVYGAMLIHPGAVWMVCGLGAFRLAVNGRAK